MSDSEQQPKPRAARFAVTRLAQVYQPAEPLQVLSVVLCDGEKVVRACPFVGVQMTVTDIYLGPRVAPGHDPIPQSTSADDIRAAGYVLDETVTKHDPLFWYADGTDCYVLSLSEWTEVYGGNEEELVTAPRSTPDDRLAELVAEAERLIRHRVKE